MDNNNNDLNQILIDNDNVNVNEFLNDNDNQNGNTLDSYYVSLIFFVLLSFCLFMEFQTFLKYMNYFFQRIQTGPDEFFEKCVKYQTLTQIYISLFYIMFLLALIVSTPLFIFEDSELSQKIIYAIINFLSYLLGPLLTGFTTLGLIFYNKVCYICDRNDPTKYMIDYYTFLVFVFAEFVGINIFLGYNTISVFNYLQNSIKFKDEGNYFIGKLFWKFGQWRRRRNEV